MVPQPQKISGLLLRWYDGARRRLPWRAEPGQTPDPYLVWLSEIMLQQTTVATVIPYFEKFRRRWPTLAALARAEPDELLAAWAGLGYYSRARNLHKCAQQLMREQDGLFPATEDELRDLPGIGPYTAAAIAAIAFDQPANVVDGNVERVMSRLFALSTPLPALKNKVRAVAAPLVPRRRAGDYAQALMDLGATVCTPRSPNCPACPLRTQCRALALGNPATYPRRLRKAPRPERRGIALVLCNEQGEIWLERRPETGLLAGMPGFPGSIWQDKSPSLTSTLKHWSGLPPPGKWGKLRQPVRHVFTHFALELTVFVAQTRGRRPAGIWLPAPEAADAGLPGLMQKILKNWQQEQELKQATA